MEGDNRNENNKLTNLDEHLQIPVLKLLVQIARVCFFFSHITGINITVTLKVLEQIIATIVYNGN